MSDISRNSTPDSEASSTASTASTKGKSMKPPAKRKRAAPKSKITTNKLTNAQIMENAKIGSSYCIGGKNEISNYKLAIKLCTILDKNFPKKKTIFI